MSGERICGASSYEESPAGLCELWREKRVRARKPHHCCECPHVIPAGEQCGYFTGLDGGKWSTWYRCMACMLLAERAAHLGGTCALLEGLSDYIDTLDEDLPDPRTHGQEFWG